MTGTSEPTAKTATARLAIEVWSDVACPFCYIGHQQFDAALAAFEHRDQVAVTWKSFQLNPDQRTDPARHPEDYLTEERGIPRERVRQMNARVEEMGRDVGIAFALEKAIIANTFRAHRVLQFARSVGKQHAMGARLFRAYFTDGLNVDDPAVLVRVAREVGIDGDAVAAMLDTDAFTDEVRRDIFEARQLGISGVPFFVLDRKYGVSGAQGSEAILAAIRQAHTEWKADA